jgi:hypothetical protein
MAFGDLKTLDEYRCLTLREATLDFYSGVIEDAVNLRS